MTAGLARPLRQRPLLRRGSGGGRWPLARIFALGASVVAALVVTAVVVGGVALWLLTEARNEVNGVDVPALFAGQELSVAVLNQETGVRGFTLSPRQEFLEPYRAGLDAEREATSTLRRLASEGFLGRLATDLDRVERAAGAWRAEFAEPAIAAGGTGSAAADTMRGRALFTEVRAALSVMLDNLQAELAAARDRQDAAATFLLVVGGVIAVVLASSLVAAAAGLRRGVLRPVSQLATQVRDVVSGGVHRPVRPAGPPEIRELGADVEAMRVHILGELVRAEEVSRRLDVQARDLERSNRDLEQFAYVASHDLQEPLRKVSSFCQLLQRRYGGQLDDRADQYIEFAVDGASRMQRLINDLLAFSRVGRTTEGFVPVAIGAAAAAAAAQLESARADVDGEIVIGELPTVPGDPGLLRQLLVNLIGNGLKFHRDGVPPVVEVSARRADDGWEITVSDNGIGIEPQYADKVFVIFQRLHGRDVYPGTGIGLALAKKIVEFHDGSIRLDGVDGPGTTVRLTLPAAPAATEETPP